jgi:hypothetical protein
MAGVTGVTGAAGVAGVAVVAGVACVTFCFGADRLWIRFTGIHQNKEIDRKTQRWQVVITFGVSS